LASDGLSDNLWAADVLDEVVQFRRSFLGPSSLSGDMDVPLANIGSDKDRSSSPGSSASGRLLRRRTLAGMLSEALCSRARRVSERRRPPRRAVSPNATTTTPSINIVDTEIDEVPFARRAREAGKVFGGGKNDDISVVVAVISPAGELAT